MPLRSRLPGAPTRSKKCETRDAAESLRVGRAPSPVPRSRDPGVKHPTTGIARGTFIPFLLLAFSGVIHGGPYDPLPHAPAAFGPLPRLDTRTYSGVPLNAPTGHQAAPKDYGDRGRARVKNRDGSTDGCTATRYGGINYSQCDPFAVAPEEVAQKPNGKARQTELGVIPSIRR